MRFVPRFLLEAAFLILLGVGSGLSDLRTSVIVLVLAGGWLLVSLVELAVWRAQSRPVGVPPPPPPPEPEAEPEPARESSPPPEVAYPLRTDAGSVPSEEIEAYTRVIGGERGDESPGSAPERE